MTDILIKIGVVVAALVILVVGEQYVESRGYDRARAEYEALIARQKIDALARLSAQVDKVREAEQSLNEFKNSQELKDADAKTTIDTLSVRLRDLADAGGRLRDPHAKGCRPGGGGAASQPAAAAGDRAADPAEAGGLLSKELAELLRRLTREADDINAAYASCRADANAVRGAVPP